MASSNRGYDSGYYAPAYGSSYYGSAYGPAYGYGYRHCRVETRWNRWRGQERVRVCY